jgi:hypothetical protein
MKKILYIEDELSKNIPRIINLFKNYLGPKQTKKLNNWLDDEFGPTNEEIENCINTSNVLEVVSSFSCALEKVILHHEDYSLYIVDRNLADSDYKIDDIKNIDSNYSEEKYERYHEREGDYLILKLLGKIDLLSSFYFLSAYPVKDYLRGKSETKGLLDSNYFSKNNYIDKGDPAGIRRLQSIINNIKSISIELENKSYCDIIRRYCGEVKYKELLALLSNDESIKNSLTNIRNLYESLLTNYYLKNEIKIGNKRDDSDYIQCGEVFKWITEWNRNSKEYKNVNCNPIIENFGNSIYRLTSKYGAHSPISELQSHVTNDSKIALIFMLKYMIIWFGDAMKDSD